MTPVNSRSAGSGSSVSRSCAAPRMPPKGFFISCARLRKSTRLASFNPSFCSWRSKVKACSASLISKRSFPGSGIERTARTELLGVPATGVKRTRALQSEAFSASACSARIHVFEGGKNCDASVPIRFLPEAPKSVSAASLHQRMSPALSMRTTPVARDWLKSFALSGLIGPLALFRVR